MDQATTTLQCCSEYQEKIEEVESKVSDRLNAKINGLHNIVERSQSGLAETLREEIRDVNTKIEDKISRKADKQYVKRHIYGLRGELDSFTQYISDPATMERIATRLKFSPRSTKETEELR